MFCPECGAEYRQGFYECSDCQVPLVHELPSEPEPEPADRVIPILEVGPVEFGRVRGPYWRKRASNALQPRTTG